MKFDIRKYIFANIIAVMQYFLVILTIVRYNIEFPPSQPGWGEGPMISDEEAAFVEALLVYLFFWLASLLLLPIEIIVRFL
ncbi:MAG: hypothetical protein LUE64_07410, partial [Candidatus Gastranaerophilales bacterium]|nr:hypothetical protein [Candidatus Gastranaerophilales bacterium]